MLSEKNAFAKFNLKPLAGDAGNRSYSRVVSKSSSDHFVLCTYPETELEQLKDFLDVHSLLHTHNILVPKVIEHTKHQMLLEDLGDISLEEAYKNKNNFYPQALNQLVAIQKIPIQGDSKPQNYAFDVEKFVWELNFAVKHLSQLLKITLSEANLKELENEFTKFSTELCNLNQVITHRDYHSRNLLVFKSEAYVIDFQDARLGPKFYDLVSLIEDSYTKLETPFKAELIESYCDKTNTPYDSDFKTNYHKQNIQRSLKACGSFASFKNRTNNERYLQYLKPALCTTFESCKIVGSYQKTSSFVETCLNKWAKYER